jgi:NitT/TauT family transport system permease protein
MDPRKLRLGFLLAAGAIALAFVLPTGPEALPLTARPGVREISAGAGLLFLIAAWFADQRATVAGLAGAVLAATSSLMLLNDPSVAGSAKAAFWMIVIAAWLSVAVALVNLASLQKLRRKAQRAVNLLVPLLFGATAFYLWEVGVRGLGVPPVLLPPPSAAAARFMGSLPTLAGDFTQTFIRGVLIGYAIGCGAGLLVAILAHRYEFLGRGLLPLGNFFSALPLVGVAPIMVMWFGFDWPSKAAVVVLVTFFPMLVNAIAGLSASGHIERDLMRSYAASPRQSLTKLYLPAALPFIFNALKINATLALIGAIVAEFFGTPTQGIGFRISTEAGRMAIDMVWAEIALAALAGMAFYGCVTLAERATTFWHPSYRT